MKCLVPATCGELVQGPYRGRLLQITCPVDLYSAASAHVDGDGPAALLAGTRREGAGPQEPRASRSGGSTPAGSPALWSDSRRRFPKARRAARRALLGWLPRGSGVVLSLRSPAPPGKGMGSSTADVVAGVAATARASGHVLTARELAGSALAVEPSDGTMLPGVALFDHRSGRIREPVAAAPPLRILVVDAGGTIATTAFNRFPRRRPSFRQRRGWKRAFRLVLHGLRSGDLEAIGRGATQSARLHQAVLPRPHLPGLLRLVDETGAVGVNVAHSGTVAGLLFPDDAASLEDVRARIRTGFPDLSCRGVRRVVGGGVRWVPATRPESPPGIASRRPVR